MLICYKNGWFIRSRKTACTLAKTSCSYFSGPGTLPQLTAFWSPGKCNKATPPNVTLVGSKSWGHDMTIRDTRGSNKFFTFRVMSWYPQKIQRQSTPLFSRILSPTLFNVSKTSASSFSPNPINMLLSMVWTCRQFYGLWNSQFLSH